GHARQLMTPLASDLLPFPGQMRREDHLKSASLPNRLSSSGRSAIVGTISRKCPAARKSSMWIRSPRVTHLQKPGRRPGGMYAGRGSTKLTGRATHCTGSRHSKDELLERLSRNVRRLSASKTNTISSYHPEGRAISV